MSTHCMWHGRKEPQNIIKKKTVGRAALHPTAKVAEKGSIAAVFSSCVYRRFSL